MPFAIIRDDIAHVKADAIVNSANPRPTYGRGTDAAIYQAAGEKRLLAERKKIGEIEPGQVAVTPAFRLAAKYIIHTVGPLWGGGELGELELLACCYRRSLQEAARLMCKSIAFPLISTGVYGFPKDKALDIALREIRCFLEGSDMQVYLVVFDRGSFVRSAKLVGHVRTYVDERYVEEQSVWEYGEGGRLSRIGRFLRKQAGIAEEEPVVAESNAGESVHWRREEENARRRESMLEALDDFRNAVPHAYEGEEDEAGSLPKGSLQKMPSRGTEKAGKPMGQVQNATAAHPAPKRSLQDVVGQLGDSFQERLFRLIDERGLSDVEVYKRANLDRRLFSKIRSNAAYKPSKKTVLALSIALRLDLDEARDLLSRAELALSPSSKGDLIVSFCLENGIYDIYEVDCLLFTYAQPTLGC